MGLSAQYGSDAGAAKVVHGFVSSPQETQRRFDTQKRVDIYRDNYSDQLVSLVAQLFTAPEVRDSVQVFSRLACANSLLKRIVKDIARPVYAAPPVRRLSSAEDQKTYRRIAHQTRMNKRMGLALELAGAVNDVAIFPRYVEGKGLWLEVMTGAQFCLFPDPDLPSKVGAVAYPVDRYLDDKKVCHWVVWDDTSYFEVDSTGELVATPTKHPLKRIPWVFIHRTERCAGELLDCHTGHDLVSASLQVALINALVLKLHRDQGEKILAAVGGDAPHDQTLDAQHILAFPDSTSVVQLDLVTDPGHYLKTKDNVETTVAANYGISRARLNQDASADDDGLHERTAELVQIAWEAEQDLFEVIKLLGIDRPDIRMTLTTELSVDYGHLNQRGDRKTVLELRKEERSMGVRSILDDIFEDNPEIEDEEQAWAEIKENMEAEAEYIKRRRALNISDDASTDKPGQDPKANGALGSLVRDGKMTKDEAADVAESGTEQE